MKLKAENLSRKYRGKYALNNVRFELRGGDVCLLLGPNGSGKTTLMKLIAGLVSPSAGSIELDGDPIGTSAKRYISYMPTENYFYSYMTVRDAGKYYADFFADFDRAAYEDRARRAAISSITQSRVIMSTPLMGSSNIITSASRLSASDSRSFAPMPEDSVRMRPSSGSSARAARSS